MVEVSAFEKSWDLMKANKKVPMPCPECRGPLEHQDGYDVKSSMKELK